MPLPEFFIEHLRTEGYHPRSDKHSKALARAIVGELVRYCPDIASEAAQGRLVWQFNFDLVYGRTTWNTDLAIGPPPPDLEIKSVGPFGMAQADPATVRIAVEIKSVMTEHRKAIKNRKRDLEAHHAHVHNFDGSAIAGGLVVINVAKTFVSPLRAEGVVTTHNNPKALVTHCVNEVRNISVASGSSPVGLDALAAVVVNLDHSNFSKTVYLTRTPAPRVGHPTHWDSFIQRLCNAYISRFGGRHSNG